MNKPYVLTFSADREKVKNALDAVPEVTYWSYCLPSAIFFVSELTAEELCKKLDPFFLEQGLLNQRYLLSEIPSNCQGRLPRGTWRLMENPDDPRPPESP